MPVKVAVSVGLGQSGALAGKAVQAQKRVSVTAAVGRQVNKRNCLCLRAHQFEI
jgi:hypothetical protein